jgi:hypothetical protein
MGADECVTGGTFFCRLENRGEKGGPFGRAPHISLRGVSPELVLLIVQVNFPIPPRLHPGRQRKTVVAVLAVD